MSDAPVNVRVRFNRPQSVAHHQLRPGNTICNKWGRGTGKTKFHRLAWYLKIAEYDGVKRPTLDGDTISGIRIICALPTLKQAVDLYARPLMHELGTEWKFLGATINKTRWIVTFPGGSWIQLLGCENEDGLRGFRCDLASLDECDDIEISTYDAVVLPWFSEPWSLDMRIASGTPKRGRGGLLYHLYRAGKDAVLGHHSSHATYRDVPETVSAAMVEKARLTTNAQRFAREWEANEDAAEGIVYSGFVSDFHIRRPDYGVPWTEILVGVDHGFEDPGVILVLGVIGSGRDAIVHAIEEIYEQHRETSWWCDRAAAIAAKYARFRQRWYADPSRPDRVQDFRTAIRSAHPNVTATFEDVDNAIEAGVDAVADRLVIRDLPDGTREARAYVSPDCKNLIRETGLYRRKRDPRNTDQVLDDIQDKDNHAADAWRYPIFSRFGGPDRVRHEAA